MNTLKQLLRRFAKKRGPVVIILEFHWAHGALMIVAAAVSAKLLLT